jgi:ubiquinone/menaquinone biosynthesis C-methylase UbiE
MRAAQAGTVNRRLDPTSFDAVDAGESDYFVRFLDARRGIEGENEVKRLIGDLLQLEPGLEVLEVGSGTGTDAAEIATRVGPGGRVVGVDLSSAMVEEAVRRTAGAGLPVEFLEGDAGNLAFDDDTFDRCRAERVLMAMAEPERAVEELVRVTRPGGVIVLSEVDAGTIFVNSSDLALADQLTREFAADLPSPAAGRRLHRYLVESGLEDIRCVPTVIRNPVGFLRMLFADRLAKLAPAEDFWSELERGEQEGWLCSGVVCFTVAGRKPQGWTNLSAEPCNPTESTQPPASASRCESTRHPPQAPRTTGSRYPAAPAPP